MSWLSELLKKNKSKIPPIDRETALWIGLKALTPEQRKALRVDVDYALANLDNPKAIANVRAFLADVKSAVNR